MESYIDTSGVRHVRLTAEEKAKFGIPSAAQYAQAAEIDRLAAGDAARAEARLTAPKKVQAGGAIDSFLAGAIGDTSHSHPGLAQGGANMLGHLARDAAIILAITVAAICLLRFLARLLRERTGLTVTDAPKKLGALWVKFQRDE